MALVGRGGRSEQTGRVILAALTMGIASPLLGQIDGPRNDALVVGVGSNSAMAEGIAAAGRQDWSGAVRVFTEAHKAEPGNADILYDLALADSNIVGHELRASMWFEAYLATRPDAANASTVRQAINGLEAQAQVNARKALDTARNMLGYFTPGSSGELDAQFSVLRAETSLSPLRERVEQINAVQRLQDSNPHHFFGAYSASVLICDTLLSVGATREAEVALDAFPSQLKRDTVYLYPLISLATTKNAIGDDREGARSLKIAEGIAHKTDEGVFDYYDMRTIGWSYLYAGHPAEARRIWSDMRTAFVNGDKSFKSTSERESAVQEINQLYDRVLAYERDSAAEHAALTKVFAHDVLCTIPSDILTATSQPLSASRMADMWLRAAEDYIPPDMAACYAKMRESAPAQSPANDMLGNLLALVWSYSSGFRAIERTHHIIVLSQNLHKRG